MMRSLPSAVRSWSMAKRIWISGSALVWFAFLILVLPLPWLIAALCAAGFHELCHMLAVSLCGGRLGGLRITGRGAALDTAALSRGQELLCALAGPVGSLSLALAGSLWPQMAVCALFHGLYNLLSVYPMDGGRLLRCGAALLLGEARAEAVCLWGARITCAMLLLAGAYSLIVLQWGCFPLFLAGFVIYKANLRKFPCKDGFRRVQ